MRVPDVVGWRQIRIEGLKFDKGFKVKRIAHGPAKGFGVVALRYCFGTELITVRNHNLKFDAI